MAIAAITFPVGGLPLFAAYLAAQALPHFLPGWPRGIRWLYPVAMIFGAVFGPRTWIPIVALVAGAGSAAARRPPAWMAGLHGGPGWTGVFGAIAGFIALAAGGSMWVFVLAAVLGSLSALETEAHEMRAPVEGPLRWAAMGMAVILGLRIIEPALVRDPLSAAVFGVSWAVGIHVGWSRAPRADARATLALPFVAAAALAGLTVVEGPGMVFLWAVVAIGVGGVLGMTGEKGPLSAWPWMPLLAIGACLAWVTGLESLDLVLWTAGSVALLGGFASLLHAGQVRPAEVAAPQASAPEVSPVLGPPFPAPWAPRSAAPAPSANADQSELAAAVMLLAALREARKIRAVALDELKQATRYSPVPEAGSRARAVMAELAEDASRTRDRLLLIGGKAD